MSTPMTVLELTQHVIAQDTRWADILTHARSTHHPLAVGGLTFFERTWRPALGSYIESVASRYAPSARAPAEAVNWWLDLLAARIYPAARAVGFADRTFLFPEITIQQGGHPSTVAGAEASGPQMDWKGWGLLATLLGAGYFFIARPRLKEQRELSEQLSASAREAGIKKGMTRAQEDAAWDSFYAKHGLRLKDGDLVKIG